MRLEIGPVAPASAVAWMEWANELFGELRSEPPTAVSLPAAAFDHIGGYLEQWMPRTRALDAPFRWHAEIDPDELEHAGHRAHPAPIDADVGDRAIRQSAARVML